jgi:hypothetical protein
VVEGIEMKEEEKNEEKDEDKLKTSEFDQKEYREVETQT